MTEEVPLSEFVTEEEADEQTAATAAEVGDEADAAATSEADSGQPDRPVDPTDVTPIESTSAYEPAGVACDGCGENVQRRFHTSEGLRCLECVSWNADN